MENLKLSARDQVMSLAELKEDNLFRKIPKELISTYISESMNIGVKTAISIKQKYKGMTPYEICSQNGIKIDVIKEQPKMKFVKIRAEYIHFSKQLNIYDCSIKDMKLQFEKLDMDLVLEEKDIKDIHISHEFFHFLEYEEIGLTNEKMDKIKIFSLFNKNRQSTILRTREIAAHMFCKEFLDLDFHPKWIDYIYLLGSSQVSYEELNKHLQELNVEVNTYFNKGGN